MGDVMPWSNVNPSSRLDVYGLHNLNGRVRTNAQLSPYFKAKVLPVVSKKHLTYETLSIKQQLFMKIQLLQQQFLFGTKRAKYTRHNSIGFVHFLRN